MSSGEVCLGEETASVKAARQERARYVLGRQQGETRVAAAE